MARVAYELIETTEAPPEQARHILDGHTENATLTRGTDAQTPPGPSQPTFSPFEEATPPDD